LPEKLALLGGKKAVTLNAPTWPIIAEEEVTEVLRTLKERDLTAAGRGGVVTDFEEAFAKYQGRKYAIAVNGGTAALHCAIGAAGAGAGDEVIVSPYTWGSTVGCILHNNAIPVFADIDSKTYNLDPDKVAEKVTPQTKAIVVVHIYGHPADMKPITETAEKNDLIVVEDCSQAHGATYHSKKVGNLGHIGCFSLQASKNMIGGEGGVLVMDDESLYQRALLMGYHPMRTRLEVKDPQLTNHIDSINWNYRIHPLAAAIAKVQLKHLDERNRIRIENANYLSKGLEDIPGVKPPHVAPGCTHVYHMYSPSYAPEELKDLPKEKYVQALSAEGVIIWAYVSIPIHLRTTFQENNFFPYGKGCPWTCHHAKIIIKYSKGDCPVAEERCEKRELNLPGFGEPCRELLDQYIGAFKKMSSNINQLL